MFNNLYSYAHPEFFETIERRRLSTEYTAELRALLPEAWTLHRRGPWLEVTNGTPHPPQGFKIHVSIVPKDAPTALRLVAVECVRRGVTFKLAADPDILGLMNSRYFDRGHAGKFMTIYPPTEEAFRELIEALYLATREADLAGPYILSDRRYKDSRILFYRYGGFADRRRLEIDGTKTPVVISPGGELVADRRLPYFEVPAWVADPFGEPQAPAEEGEPTLHGRYRIEAAIRFSNAGGTYKAVDLHTGANVVIKEARPFTSQWTADRSFLDSCALRNWEWRVLDRLKHLDCVPKPVELFVEWEHTFLVEELVTGVTYWSYWADQRNILTPYVRWPGRLESFVPKFRAMAAALIDVVESVHNAGVVLGDLSPRNVLVHPDPLRVVVVDLDSAVIDDTENADVREFGRQWHTPGFLNPERRTRATLERRDDYYAVGMLLYCAVIPVQEFFGLNATAAPRFIEEMVRLGVPRDVQIIVQALLDGAPQEARRVLEGRMPLGGSRTAVLWDRRGPNAPPPARDDANVLFTSPQRASVPEAIARHILSTTDTSRRDRLWPGHFVVFTTNSLSVAYGACGTTLFLHDVLGDIPPEVRQWLLDQPITLRDYPPGLHLGLAGVAYAFAELGLRERAEEVMRLTYDSPLRFTDPTMLYGIAGWGWASLYFYDRTGDPYYLERAAEGGRRLAETATVERGGLNWRHHADDRVHFGFGYGASGIALFLLELGLRMGDAPTVAAATKALDYDLANVVDTPAGWGWGRYAGDNLVEPYWLHGNAGVGTTVLRFFDRLGDERYGEVADRIADSMRVKFTLLPGQWEGMSGVGEFLLDAFRVTGGQRHLEAAQDIAESILWYRVDRAGGAAFPGRVLSRLSTDYATGSSGVGAFLDRLRYPRPRRLVDLDAGSRRGDLTLAVEEREYGAVPT